MVKHCLVWKEVKCKNVKGNLVRIELPKLIANAYRGTLVSQILAMPRQAPLSFDAAVNLTFEKQMEAFTSGQVGKEPGQFSWYFGHFVEWISSLGYHIELSGDEFETCAATAILT